MEKSDATAEQRALIAMLAANPYLQQADSQCNSTLASSGDAGNLNSPPLHGLKKKAAQKRGR